jgi:hypothetical protein
MNSSAFKVVVKSNGVLQSQSMATIQEALRHIDGVVIEPMGTYDHADSSALPKSVWVHFTADEEEPYHLVSGEFELQGAEATDAQIEYLRKEGVCVALSTKYPDGEKYGQPFSEDAHSCKFFVGEHRFKIDAQVFDANPIDRGDDGIEEYWLNIKLPDGHALETLQ